MVAQLIKPSSLLAHAPEQAIALALHRRRRQARALKERDPWRTAWARPEQIAPEGDWTTWLILAGRGWGKTRTGAEFTREELCTGLVELGALVGRTAADVRDVMVEGPSGLVKCCERYGIKVRYEPSKRRVTFPNGAKLICYSAEEPDNLRGPNIGFAWSDEVAAWDDPDAWDQLQYTLRAVNEEHPDRQPRQVATTTPRPRPHIKEIINDPATVVTRGKTSDNARNLARVFLEKITRRYQGTRLGRQELDGELLDDVEGALWTHTMIDSHRVNPKDVPHLKRLVVAIDPTVGGPTTEHGDYAGITAAGVDRKGEVYILETVCQLDERGAELPGIQGMPADWAAAGVRTYDKHKADRLVAEANQGGEMVRQTILATLKGKEFQRRSGPPPAITLVHAKRGKALRAEPVSALYEQGRVHHVGLHKALEDQMTSFPVATDHDDLVDSLVYAVTDLTGGADKTIQGWR